MRIIKDGNNPKKKDKGNPGMFFSFDTNFIVNNEPRRRKNNEIPPIIIPKFASCTRSNGCHRFNSRIPNTASNGSQGKSRYPGGDFRHKNDTWLCTLFNCYHIGDFCHAENTAENSHRF